MTKGSPFRYFRTMLNVEREALKLRATAVSLKLIRAVYTALVAAKIKLRVFIRLVCAISDSPQFLVLTGGRRESVS